MMCKQRLADSEVGFLWVVLIISICQKITQLVFLRRNLFVQAQYPSGVCDVSNFDVLWYYERGK